MPPSPSVWHADLAENFNVSVPYLQIEKLRVTPSKFGSALVIETRVTCGGYRLGFRIDPVEQLEAIFKEISSLYEVFAVNPIFGIEFNVEEKPEKIEKLTVERKDDDVEITEVEDGLDMLAAYYVQGAGEEKKPVFNPDLGLACEELAEGFTTRSLFELF